MTKVASHGLSLFWPSAGWGPEQPEHRLIKLNLMGNYAPLYVASSCAVAGLPSSAFPGGG
jgi:hypothetical protein